MISGVDKEWTYILKRWTRVLKGLPDSDWNNYTRKNDFPDGIWVKRKDPWNVKDCAITLKEWCKNWNSDFQPNASERNIRDEEISFSLISAICQVFSMISVEEWEKGLLAFVFYKE